MDTGMKGILVKDANLRYDSYGSPRPDGKATVTLVAGTKVTISNVVKNPKSEQTHTIHVNDIGWIRSDAVKVDDTCLVEKKKLEAGMKVLLAKDANLKYDSYGSPRPDGQPTKTLATGTKVEITKVIADPKPGQTHPIHINGIGWIQVDEIKMPYIKMP